MLEWIKEVIKWYLDQLKDTNVFIPTGMIPVQE